jgi:hypothetical protein
MMVESKFLLRCLIFHREMFVMKRLPGFLLVLLMLAFIGLNSEANAQNRQNKFKSQEISEDDGLPVLLKHLPDWEAKRSDAAFVLSLPELKKAAGDHPVLDLIDFAGGTEAVTASYPAGRLLIVEYSSPQASVDADNRFSEYLAQNPDMRTVYRRIGNYNVFVFDADPAAVTPLIDQVKYEKNIQWLGEDPFLFKNLERNFVNTTADIFVSTVEWIVLGIGSTLLLGIILGYFYYQFRERQRLTMNEFSDAGGMVRLNLDGLTPDLSTDRLLNE